MQSSGLFRLCLAITILLATSAAVVALPLANYNPVTGNITFVLDEAVIGLDFKSSTGALIAANGNQLTPGATYDTSLAPDILSWLDFGTFHGTLNAGNIVTPGTSQADLEFCFLRGFCGLTPCGEIKVVPEPGTLALLLLAATAWSGTIRKRRLVSEEN